MNRDNSWLQVWSQTAVLFNILCILMIERVFGVSRMACLSNIEIQRVRVENAPIVHASETWKEFGVANEAPFFKEI